jgi:hypothetical protein
MNYLNRWDVINILIRKNDYKSYLEVGTQNPNSNFNKIEAEHKVSIDPFPKMPSTPIMRMPLSIFTCVLKTLPRWLMK